MSLDLKGIVFDNDNTIAKIYPNPKIYWQDVFLKVVEECGGSVPKGKEEEYMLSYYTNRGFIEKLETIGLKTSMDEFQKAKGVVDERERVAYTKAGEKPGLFPRRGGDLRVSRRERDSIRGCHLYHQERGYGRFYPETRCPATGGIF